MHGARSKIPSKISLITLWGCKGISLLFLRIDDNELSLYINP
jgi:hypothetical protein